MPRVFIDSRGIRYIPKDTQMKIELTDVALLDVNFDQKSGLFPYSPRAEIDYAHVAELVKSIETSEFWNPIYVRKETMEGIAGNHRFLAAMKIAEKSNISLAEYTIPAFMVDCEESEAVLLALLENDLRLGLTHFERTKGIIKAAEGSPEKVEKILNLDEPAIKQLSFWPDQMNFYEELIERQRVDESKLTKEWLQVINEGLADFRGLHRKFMQKLRNPIWVSTRSVEILKAELSLSIFSMGIPFKPGNTWHETPPPICLGQCLSFENLIAEVTNNPELVNDFGVVEGTCPKFRLRIQSANIFSPGKDTDSFIIPMEGIRVLQGGADQQGNPYAVPGTYSAKPFDFTGFCLDPKANEHDSCFRLQENEARKLVFKQLKADAARTVPPVFIKQREALKLFVWEEPVREGQLCFPANCVHEESELCCVAVEKPNGESSVFCIDEVCGAECQQVEYSNDIIARAEQHERDLQELNASRAEIVEEYFFSGKHSSLEDEEILELLEKFLAPEWESQAMQAMAQGFMHNKNHESTGTDYPSLREEYVTDRQMLIRWLICLLMFQG
jgi:hypothetical protein